MQTHAAIEHFDQAVLRYNQGIAQFPAVLLAWPQAADWRLRVSVAGTNAPCSPLTRVWMKLMCGLAGRRSDRA